MRNNRLQYGSTLLEALIAMFILALGMMSYSAVDARLRIASDIAKQRSEALRIAQEDMENFRAFGTLTPDGTIVNNLAYDSIVNAASNKAVLASDVVTTTNATYTITRNIVASATNMKDVMIRVGWNDRNGTAQRVVLRSVIAGVAPVLAAAMTIAQSASSHVKDPLGRDVVVPIPAKDLGDGTSAFKPTSDSTRAFVFDNESGEIISQCIIAANIFTPSITSGNLENCNSVTGYLLSGYIRFSLGVSRPDPAAANSAPPGDLSIRTDLSAEAPPANAHGRAKMLNVSGFWPTVNDAAGVTTGYSTAPDCASESLKTVLYTATTSTGQLVAAVPAGLSLTASAIAPYVGVAAANILTVTEPDLIEHFVRYICVVYPIDLDTDSSTPNAWTGRATIWPAATWSLGTEGSTYKVCRFSSDYNGNGYVSLPPPPYTAGSSTPITEIDNTEHPYAFLNTTSGLNNQNFLIVDGNKNCPTDSDIEVDGRGNENYTNETTVLHQP